MASSQATAMIPFAEEQLAPLRSLLADSSAEQRTWLSGYIAGFQAANAPAAAAAPPAAKPALTVLYATESGNSEALAASAKREAGKLGFAARVLDMADASLDGLAKAGNLLVIASTWGEGDPPQRAEAFFAALMASDAPPLAGLRYAVLALGDRAYAKFCETGRRIDTRLAELGATRLAPVEECDLDFEVPARAWIGTTLRELGAETPASVIHVDFMRPPATEAAAHSRARPFAAEIAELVNLNSSRSTVRNFHIALSLAGSGLAYEPGDAIGVLPTNDPALVDDVLRAAGLDHDDALRAALATRHDITTLTQPQISAYAALVGDAKLAAIGADPLQAAAFRAERQFIDLLDAAPHKLAAEQLAGLLRPLAPRLYSVASSRKLVDETAELLVAEVAWEAHGRARRGVASGEIARRRVGETLPAYVQANRHFRLPDEAERPVLMIGPGTGVAPFRAFMQEQEALGQKRRSWLFFGARQFTHDFLYQLDWQEWLRAGLLTRMDVAFSRDQPEKQYVQDRMWEQRRDLFAWLEEGAVLYVCGDAAAMAKDVHAMLARIVADQSGRDGEAYLRDLVQAGRYKRDVY
ncbi:MAG TPA: flavodoxin domain-containing protein [Acetobacteraceae bacterium]|nr:flavodoxin domain-containing protein [Acetobacteraceae bacterium]